MPSRHPVLLIHGLGDTGELFRKMADYLAQGGREVHCIDLVPNDGSETLDRLAHQVESYVSGRFAESGMIDLVGFSMGGIVSRHYVQRLGGSARVRRFITISSPHRGTWTAFLRNNSGVRQMRPGSVFLQDLNRDRSALEQTSFTSIWTRFDLMILPASNSVLPGGRSIHIGVAAHPLMVTSRRVLRIVRDLLSQS